MIAATMPTYARADIAFARGEGPYLFDAEGRRYLDFGGGIAVTALGHCHPHLVATLKAQAEKLWHVSNLYRIPDQERLAERLVRASFADTVFFCNSGLEAVECALKIARKYQHARGETERYRVITVEGAFHGRSLATLAAGRQAKHLAGFGPIVDGFDQVPFNNHNALRAAIGPESAAILVEPVQGEGGIRVLAPDYLRALRAAADEFGLLLIFDEVQTGMGRTGRLFAHEGSGVTPDIMAIAKGMGGGFPVGACLATDKAAAAMTAGAHGSTFGGNPLAMAVANAVLDLMEKPGFMAHARAMGEALAKGLAGLARAHPAVIAEARGKGLLQGLKLNDPHTNSALIARLQGDGLLCVAAGENVVRLAPALIVEPAHIDEALGLLDAACRAMSA